MSSGVIRGRISAGSKLEWKGSDRLCGEKVAMGEEGLEGWRVGANKVSERVEE